MSFDAGGLAQMTYNPHNSMGGLGMPGSGFASRRKNSEVKRLSVAPPSKISTIDEDQPAPRTSRSHLLAGLRTAPKSPGFPTSAPPTQSTHQPPGLGDSRYAGSNSIQYQQGGAKTATSAGFSNSYQAQQNQYSAAAMNHFYSPEQVLAPPSIQVGEDVDESQMDPQLYDELMRTNQYLAEQQMRLQQQLINVTAAAQQFQSMNLGQQHEAQYAQMGMNAGPAYYSQQMQQGVQPIIQPVQGQPGLYTVYNPMTGQTSLAYDQNPQATLQQQQHQGFQSPPPAATAYRNQIASPPPQSSSPMNPVSNWRSNTPPKTTPSPPRDEANPLPPPSANAFRPNHRKNNASIATGQASMNAPVEALKTAGLKSAGFPMTPATGTFGPGQAREGEHPIRQPRGPPSLEELVAKPTTKFEGSKNFATRQRRGALNHLVRAGIERRGARSNESIGSNGSVSPTSEHGITFSVSSDDDRVDDVSVRSGSASLVGEPESNQRSPVISAIGSERKGMKERNPFDSQFTANSVSSEDDSNVGGKLVEVKPESHDDAESRKSPLLGLAANAEKRRSFVL